MTLRRLPIHVFRGSKKLSVVIPGPIRIMALSHSTIPHGTCRHMLSPSRATPDSVSGNQPIVEPGVDEGDVDQPIDEYPEELLRAAGLTPEQAERDFDSVEDIQDAVRMLDYRSVQAGRDAISSQPQQPEQKDIVVEEDDWSLPETENGWDDDTKAVVSSLTDRFKGMLAKRDEQIKAQNEFLQGYVAEQQKTSARQELAEFDDLVNALPDEYSPYLGRGYAYDFHPQSLQFQNRLHLEQTMDALQEGNRISGRSPIPRDELMMRSLSVAFPEIMKQQIREEVVEQVGNRRQMMTRRPTHRHPQALSPVAQAGKTAQEWYDKHNMSNDDLDEYVF
jgi:hypothetical protein